MPLPVFFSILCMFLHRQPHKYTNTPKDTNKHKSFSSPTCHTEFTWEPLTSVSVRVTKVTWPALFNSLAWFRCEHRPECVPQSTLRLLIPLSLTKIVYDWTWAWFQPTFDHHTVKNQFEAFHARRKRSAKLVPYISLLNRCVAVSPC